MVNARVIGVGLIASMVMGMIEMAYEAVAGNGFWSPATYIAATILRDLQNVGSPVSFQFVPVVLGLMGHMMNSVILGILFAALTASRWPGQASQTLAGVGYGTAVFFTMWFLALPIVDPVMLRLNGVVFLVSHMMWGGALGLILGWSNARAALRQYVPAF